MLAVAAALIFAPVRSDHFLHHLAANLSESGVLGWRLAHWLGPRLTRGIEIKAAILSGLDGATTLLEGILLISGKAWGDLERGMHIAILGMLRVCAAGFLTYGVLLLWLLLPLNRGETWAAWAILSSAATMLVPILWVTVWLRRFEPKAKTPILPSVVVLLLVLAGAGTALI